MTNTGAWGVQVLAALLATASVPWEAEAMDTIETRMTTRFVAFEHEQDPALVQASLDELAASQNVPATSDADVAGAYARWLRFLEGLDSALDPHWQARTPPVQGVPPSSATALSGSCAASPRKRGRWCSSSSARSQRPLRPPGSASNSSSPRAA